MIKISDFSEETLKVFNDTILRKEKDSVHDFILRLLNADFEPKEIKIFIKDNIGYGYNRWLFA